MWWVVHVCDGGVVWRWCNVDASVVCVLCVSMLRYVVLVCVMVVLAHVGSTCTGVTAVVLRTYGWPIID